MQDLLNQPGNRGKHANAPYPRKVHMPHEAQRDADKEPQSLNCNILYGNNKPALPHNVSGVEHVWYSGLIVLVL